MANIKPTSKHNLACNHMISNSLSKKYFIYKDIDEIKNKVGLFQEVIVCSKLLISSKIYNSITTLDK